MFQNSRLNMDLRNSIHRQLDQLYNSNTEAFRAESAGHLPALLPTTTCYLYIEGKDDDY